MRDAGASVDGRSERLPYLLEFRPNSEFGYDTARNKLVNLRIGQPGGPNVTFIVPGDVVTHEDDMVGGDMGFTGRQGQLLRLSGWINMESRLTVGCAGAVLSYLQRRRATAFLPGDHAAGAMFRIGTIEMFSLKDSMFVNADTLLSLQIHSDRISSKRSEPRTVKSRLVLRRRKGRLLCVWTVPRVCKDIARPRSVTTILPSTKSEPSRSSMSVWTPSVCLLDPRTLRFWTTFPKACRRSRTCESSQTTFAKAY